MIIREKSRRNAPPASSVRRCSLVCLGYSREADSQHFIPIVVVVANLQAISREWDVFVKQGWWKLVQPTDRCYIEDLLEEWTGSESIVAGVTVDALSELSVGPLRTVERRDLFESGKQAAIRTFLGSGSVRLQSRHLS